MKRKRSKLRMENANRSRIYFFRIDRAFNRTVEVDIVKRPKRKNCYTDFTVHSDYIEKGKSIKLMQNGIQYGDTVTVENSGEFQYIFKNIPCYDYNLRAYKYEVEVSDAENYTVKDLEVVKPSYENKINENSYYVISGYDRKHKTPLYRLSADYKKIKAEDDCGFPNLSEIWKTSSSSNVTSDGKDGYIIKDIINGMTLTPENDYEDICLGDGTLPIGCEGDEEELLWSYYDIDKLFYYNSEFYEGGYNFCEVLRIDRDRFYLDGDRCFRANKKTIENYLSDEDVNGHASTIYLTKVFREDGDNLYSFYKYKQEIVSKKNKNKIVDNSLLNNKVIDYLGDGVINPDTDIKNTEDIYRLYLDIAENDEACDILFVLDNTSSMDEEDMGSKDGETISRYEMLEKVLKNVADDERGIIKRFLEKNPENKVAVTTFSGGYKRSRDNIVYKDVKDKYNHIVIDWTGEDEFTPENLNIGEERHIGTNYISAYIRACEMFNKEAVKNNGHRKIMIFISDGQPNTVLERDSEGVFSENSEIKCMGSNQATIQYTYEALNEIRKELPSGLIIYTMGISGDTDKVKSVLTNIAENPQRYYYVKDNKDFNIAIMDLIRSTFHSVMEINDRLSEYVSLLKDNTDLKISLDIRDGDETRVYTLWEGGLNENKIGSPSNINLSERDIELMEYVFVDKPSINISGDDFIDYVSYEDGNEEVIHVKFKEDVHLNKNIRFTLSYNVKTNEKAVSEYKKNGYHNVGDENTDYRNNTTSSGKAGFYSNEAAVVLSNIYKEESEHNYTHPVVQVKIEEEPATPSEPEKPATPSEPDKPKHHGGGGGGGGSRRRSGPGPIKSNIVNNQVESDYEFPVYVKPHSVSLNTSDESHVILYFVIIFMSISALIYVYKKKLD